MKKLARGAAATGLTAALVYLVALNLRPSITGLGLVLPFLREAEGLGETALGVLGAIPLLAFAAVSPIVYRPARRIGIDRTVMIALGVLVAGILVRSYTGSAGLWIGTVILGSAIAVANVLVPAIIKRDYPRHVGTATGAYSACMTLSQAAAAAITVPIATSRGWQDAMGFWALPALLTALIWLPRARRTPQDGPGAAAPASSIGSGRDSVWRRPQAWLLTAFMGLQSMTFYTIVTWWATVEIEGGVPAPRAGLHMTILQLCGIVGSLGIPQLMKRTRSMALPAVAATTPVAVGALGLLIWPALGTLWVVIAGVGQGAALVVALSMISMAGRDAHDTTQLSGMAQSVGYLLAAVGPILVGSLAESTGVWALALVVIVIQAVVQASVGVIAGRTVRRAD